MSYFYKATDKDAVKAFLYEDLKVLGIKIPKLDKIAKAQAEVEAQTVGGTGRSSQVHLQIEGKEKGGAVFGVPISLMNSIEDPNIGHIPQFLVHTRQYLSNHLNTEGLFRKTGSVSRQKDLAQHIEDDGGGCMDEAHVYDVTSVIKQFFRGMPEPLIPHILQDAFVQAVQLSPEDSRVYSLALLCLLMPSEHLTVFRYMLEILSDVASNSKVNKMNAHNLAVCLTPNLFHTKLGSKQIQLQTQAIQLCIENVINIGVIPPSVNEKVVMLKSLEAHDMSSTSVERGRATASGSSHSIRKKKRSGSLQGSSLSIVGSIRRSVEKLKSRASRRSASVPDNLNMLDEMDDCHRSGFRSTNQSAVGAGSNPTTPHIMRKCNSGDTSGFSVQKRKAIQSSLMGTPMSINSRSQSADNVFDSPDSLAQQTMTSIDSTARSEFSRMSSPSRKKSWTSLKSPFSKRRRSASAGPSSSPSKSKHNRSSSKTKKLIRRLSGGKKKTPDMVGQRLAFTTEDDAAQVRRRMPSAPTALCLGDDVEVDGQACNEECMRQLETDVLICGNENEDLTEISRIQTMRESRRDQMPLRKRAKSADARTLRRGRPNHPDAGLAKVRVSSKQAEETSTENLHSHVSSTERVTSNAELIAAGVPRSVDGPDSEPQAMETDPDAFDSRMERVALLHSALFSDKPAIVPRQHSAGLMREPEDRPRPPLRRATFSDNHGRAARRSQRPETGRPPRHESFTKSSSVTGERRFTSETLDSKEAKPLVVIPDISDIRAWVKSQPNSELSLSHGNSAASLDSGVGLNCADHGQQSSKSSLRSIDSGIGKTAAPDCQMSSANRQTLEDGRKPDRLLTVRGAELPMMNHADSIADLQDARKVKQSVRVFGESPSCARGRLAAKPPRHAPVRIPTVFAKNDPRAMRYKMAADAVRRRSLQRAERADSPDSPSPSSRVPSTAGVTDRTSADEDIESVSPKARQRVAPVARQRASHRSLSLKSCNSPPRRLPGAGYFTQNSRATAYIPISTDLVRGVNGASPLAKNMSHPDSPGRSPLRERSPNVRPSASQTPKIKSSLLPLDSVRSSIRGGQSSSYKSPRSRPSMRQRAAPYTTSSPHPTSKPSHRPSAI